MNVQSFNKISRNCNNRGHKWKTFSGIVFVFTIRADCSGFRCWCRCRCRCRWREHKAFRDSNVKGSNNPAPATRFDHFESGFFDFSNSFLVRQAQQKQAKSDILVSQLQRNKDLASAPPSASVEPGLGATSASSQRHHVYPPPLASNRTPFPSHMQVRPTSSQQHERDEDSLSDLSEQLVRVNETNTRLMFYQIDFRSWILPIVSLRRVSLSSFETSFRFLFTLWKKFDQISLSPNHFWKASAAWGTSVCSSTKSASSRSASLLFGS